jgi:hypothetical protein
MDPVREQHITASAQQWERSIEIRFPKGILGNDDHYLPFIYWYIQENKLLYACHHLNLHILPFFFSWLPSKQDIDLSSNKKRSGHDLLKTGGGLPHYLITDIYKKKNHLVDLKSDDGEKTCFTHPT